MGLLNGGYLRKQYALLIGSYVFFVAYVVWQYWLYRQQGWEFVSWHTHLAPYVFLLLLLFTLRVSHTETSNWQVAALSVVVTLACVEIALEVVVKEQLYYKYKYDPRNYYHTWPPKQFHYLNSSEFSYHRVTNSLGFADKE